MGVSCRQSSLSMCHSRNCQRSMWPPLTTAFGRPVGGSSNGTVRTSSLGVRLERLDASVIVPPPDAVGDLSFAPIAQQDCTRPADAWLPVR